MMLLHLYVLILLGVCLGQSPTLQSKGHMLYVRIRSDLFSAGTKLSTALSENAVKMTYMHTSVLWAFL